MTERRRGGAAAWVLALVLAASACSSDDNEPGKTGGPGVPSSGSTSGEPDASTGPVADAAAAAYTDDLERYQRQVARAAARTDRATRADSAEQFRAAQRLFATALEAAPELEAVDGGAEASESYARTALVAENVQGFVDEHTWMQGWDIAENVRLNTVLYEISSKQYSQSLRVGAAYEKAMSGPGDTSAKLKKAVAVEIRTELRNAAGIRRRIEGIAGEDTFTPSLRDHLLNEMDVSVAEGERYLAYVEAVPGEAIERDLFRNAFSSGSTLPGGGVTNAPALRTVASRELLAEGLAQLLEAAETGQGELPLAGDIYRELILRLLDTSAQDADESAAELAIEEQLYWLWRIHEVEDTPVEAFDNARLTIKVQDNGGSGLALVNVDSRFDELAAMFASMIRIIRDGPESMAANKPWIIELLDRPYPDVFDDVVVRAREAATLLSDDGSPASAELMAVGPGLLKSLKRAADDLDDLKVFRADFRAAVDGTRPPTDA